MMEGQDDKKGDLKEPPEEDIIILDDNSFMPQINRIEDPQELRTKLEALNMKMLKYQNNDIAKDFRRTHFTLANITRYARENISIEIRGGDKWSPEDNMAFGQYVISIIALTTMSHFALKNMIEKYTPKKELEQMINGKAEEFICSYYNAKKITELVWNYFQSGYYKRRHLQPRK